MRWDHGGEGDNMELETVVEEDEACCSVKSMEARVSVSNPKCSLQNVEKRPAFPPEGRMNDDTSRIACCIHSVTLKQSQSANNQLEEDERTPRKTSPPSNSRCCGKENEHFNSLDDDITTDSGVSSKSHQICVMNCTDVYFDGSNASSPQGSFRSKGENDMALETVAPPGSFGEISVQNSSDVHFGNKIYTAPITVVNQVGGPGDDSEFVVDSSSFKGQRQCSNTSYVASFLNVSARARLNFSGSTGRNILTALYFLVIVGLSIGLIIALISSSTNDETSTPPSVPDDQDVYFNETWFYTREDWGASPPSLVIKFQQPLDFVIISHTHVLSLVCTGHVFCGIYIRIMQKIQMAYNLHDISYNYMISSGTNGALYVGRGANIEGEHTPGYNPKSLGIAFIGDYNTRIPNANQIAHAKMLIEEAVKLGKLSDRYKLIGQGQLTDTDSPGKNLMAEIQNWDHWVEHPMKFLAPSTIIDYVTGILIPEKMKYEIGNETDIF